MATINYWILVIDSFDIDLSFIETAEDTINFSYNFNDKNGDFINVSNNDLILGYNKKFKSFKYLFKTKNILDDKLILEKCISLSNGGLLDNSGYEKILNETSILQVEKKQFFSFYEILINAIPFYSKDTFSLKSTKNPDRSHLKRNWIFFGAPGTGKSFKLNEEKEKLIGKDEESYERVTFHPDYSYSSFIGSYRPVKEIDKKNNQSIISYDYVPGPFMRILSKAINNSSKQYLLIIEEINRANVAAVFGDVFQLLDRNDNHESEYPIDTSKEMREYLIKEYKEYNGYSDMQSDKDFVEKFKKIKIPSNMFIWATMNSADQGVFFMDAAFKRRWDFKHIDIDEGQSKISQYKFKLPNSDAKIDWNLLRKSINIFLLDKLNVKEDKLLGPFFISDIVKLKDNFKDDDFIESFKNKVLMYLYEDAAKSNPYSLFNESNKKTYSKICKDFDNKGINIFNEVIIKNYRELKNLDESYKNKKNDD